jgi:hypothetical protein
MSGAPDKEARKVTENDRILFALINRSRDIGDGWRQVSDQLWPHIRPQAHPQLVEVDEVLKRIRFTTEGLTVLRYTL